MFQILNSLLIDPFVAMKLSKQERVFYAIPRTGLKALTVCSKTRACSESSRATAAVSSTRAVFCWVVWSSVSRCH